MIGVIDYLILTISTLIFLFSICYLLYRYRGKILNSFIQYDDIIVSLYKKRLINFTRLLQNGPYFTEAKRTECKQALQSLIKAEEEYAMLGYQPISIKTVIEYDDYDMLYKNELKKIGVGTKYAKLFNLFYTPNWHNKITLDQVSAFKTGYETVPTVIDHEDKIINNIKALNSIKKEAKSRLNKKEFDQWLKYTRCVINTMPDNIRKKASTNISLPADEPSRPSYWELTIFTVKYIFTGKDEQLYVN